MSVLGSATTTVLLPLLAVLAFDAGPGWMGALATATWLPWLLIGLPAGAWVDRLPARGAMITADLVSAAAYASVPAAWALDLLTLPHLVAVSFTGGVAAVFFKTAYVVLLPQVVAPEHLESANGRMFGTESAMHIAGPGLGGLVAQWWSAAFGLVADVVSFLVSALCLWQVRPDRPPPERTPAGPLGERIREGVDFVRGDPYLPWMTAIGGLANFGLTGIGALQVLFLVDHLDLSPSGVGIVMMAGSTGGLLGAAAAAWCSRRLGSGRAFELMTLGSGVPAVLVPLAWPGAGAILVAAGLFLIGVFAVAGNVVRAAWRQKYVPAPLMGRVVTSIQFVNFGTMPVAGVLAGWLGSTVGVRETIALMALVHVGGSLLILLSPLRGLRALPSPSLTAAC